MQGKRQRPPAWLTMFIMALMISLWVFMFTTMSKQKQAQQGAQQAVPKVFPSLQEIRASSDVNQAIRVWQGQVADNPKSPDNDLTLLKIAIACEYVLQPPDYRGAFRAYQALASSYGRSPFAMHALFQAAQLAEQRLHEPQLAVKLYEKVEGRFRGKAEEAIIWGLSGDQFVPVLKGHEIRLETARILDGYYRDRTLYKALAVLVRVTGNDKRYSYGLALILTAILVQGFLWLLPFTRKQYETMRKMQEIAPEMKKIQATFKADPRRMQTEVFALYKRNHVNPMTGCFLGMVIQIPFLWAIYAAIRHFQYPLADASFLWMKSLADADLPLLILYCGSMYLTTRFGPGSDPSQAQQQKTMALLMPVMFFFLFRSWPSGFLLYWLATNLLSMGQRYLIMHKRPEQVGAARDSLSYDAAPQQAEELSTVAVLEGSAATQQDPSSVDSEVTQKMLTPKAGVTPDGRLGGQPERDAPLSRGTRRGGKKRRKKPI